MAVAKWVNEGENRVLNILLGATPVDGAWYLGLYKNAVEPDEPVTLTEFTEPTGYGYARKQLTRGQWSIADDLAAYAQQTFLASGGDWGLIYGYFIATTANNSGKVMAICHFDAPLNVLNGKGIKIVPKIRSA
jgi:hypothetical protein